MNEAHRTATAGTDSIEKIIADFPDVFDSTTLTPIKGEPMKIVINRDIPGYRPMQVVIDPSTVTLRWFIDSDVIEPMDIRFKRTLMGMICSSDFFN